MADTDTTRDTGLTRARGTGRSKREAAKLAVRREKVAALYLSGQTQDAIALAVGCSRTTVSIDLVLIRAEWRNSALCNMNSLVERELERIDRIEVEAWAAWERSQLPAESVTTTADETRKTVEGQSGDPRYLQIALKCVEDRRRLLGLDAPSRTESKVTADVTATTTHFLPRDQMRRQVLDRFAQLEARAELTTVREAIEHPHPN